MSQSTTQFHFPQRFLQLFSQRFWPLQGSYNEQRFVHFGRQVARKIVQCNSASASFFQYKWLGKRFQCCILFFFYVRIKLWIILPNYKLKRHWHGDLTSSFRDFYVSLVVFGKYRDNTYYRKLKLRNAPRSPALYPATGYNLKKKIKRIL